MEEDEGHSNASSIGAPPPLLVEEVDEGSRSGDGLVISMPDDDDSKQSASAEPSPPVRLEVQQKQETVEKEQKEEEKGEDGKKAKMETPSPPKADVKSTSTSPPDASGKRKRRSHAVKKDEEAPVRKSTRNNKGEHPHLEINYTEGLQLMMPRATCAPIGGVRTPYQLPKSSVPPSKERGKLAIDMVGPAGKPAKEKEKQVMKSMYGSISVGHDFQAEMPGEFPRSSLDALPDRDEVVWMEQEEKKEDGEACSSRPSPVELEQAWCAIRRQFGGSIPLDAMLHRLYTCGYSVDGMLAGIEEEQWHCLPQPPPRMSVAQQKEFSRKLVKEKRPRQHQDRFMKTHYIGEIVAHYYNTKRKGCFVFEHQLCACRASLSSEQPPPVARYECHTCCGYLWREAGRERAGQSSECLVCELYRQRTGKQRPVTGRLFEDDEKVAKKWLEMEMERDGEVTKDEVLSSLEEARRDWVCAHWKQLPEEALLIKKRDPEEMARVTAPYHAEIYEGCPVLRPRLSEHNRAAMREWLPKDKMKVVKAIHKCGVDWSRVSAATGFPLVDIQHFYKQYNSVYKLDQFSSVGKKAWSAVGAAGAHQTRSASPDEAAAAGSGGRRRKTGSAEPKGRRSRIGM